MFTRCPECQTTQTLTVAQLRDSRGMVQCSHCTAWFDGLALISESEDTAIETPSTTEGLPWENKSPSNPHYWGSAFVISFLLLMAQIIYFEGYAFTQNSKIRPVLAAFCGYLHCLLPEFKNLDKFNLVGAFNPTPDGHYEFHAAISNQAAFPQPYPNLSLTLLNFNGQVFATRTFQAKDYLPESAQTFAIQPSTTTEINLKIAPPKSPIGGSSFELTN
ncbi:MAG: DUF3426 domain-containing protein [Methylococcaceae bacterium]|nr:DUF3426 domain-containing protein [Methylococcaceae bacterium]